MADKLYINAEDVAARLCVSVPTIYRWVKIKKFPEGKSVERTGMPGPRHTTLWDIRIVDQWAIDNGVIIRIDPTLPDRDYLEAYDDAPWAKNVRLVVYAVVIGAISSLLYAWVF